MTRTSDVPDKTLDELLEADEDAEYSMDEDDLEKMREEYEAKLLGAQAMFQIFAITELFFENKITFKEYVEMEKHMEGIADEKGADLP